MDLGLSNELEKLASELRDIKGMEKISMRLVSCISKARNYEDTIQDFLSIGESMQEESVMEALGITFFQHKRSFQ